MTLRRRRQRLGGTTAQVGRNGACSAVGSLPMMGTAGWQEMAGHTLACCHPAAPLQCLLSSGPAATAQLVRPAALPGLRTQGSLLL